MNPISRRGILGGIAAAPAAIGMAGAEMARMSQMATIAGGSPFNPAFAKEVGYPVTGNGMSAEMQLAMKNARKALMKLDRVPIQARIVWIEGMKSWTPGMRARAIIEIHQQIEAEKKPYMKILGHFMEDDD